MHGKTAVWLILTAVVSAASAAPRSQLKKKAVYGTISSSSSAVARALPASAITEAKKLTGKPGAFLGVVTEVDLCQKTCRMIYINFSTPWSKSISADIPASAYGKFPNVHQLLHRRVLVTGRFILYERRHPEILVSSPAQIRIIQNAPRAGLKAK